MFIHVLIYTCSQQHRSLNTSIDQTCSWLPYVPKVTSTFVRCTRTHSWTLVRSGGLTVKPHEVTALCLLQHLCNLVLDYLIFLQAP